MIDRARSHLSTITIKEKKKFSQKFFQKPINQLTVSDLIPPNQCCALFVDHENNQSESVVLSQFVVFMPTKTTLFVEVHCRMARG